MKKSFFIFVGVLIFLLMSNLFADVVVLTNNYSTMDGRVKEGNGNAKTNENWLKIGEYSDNGTAVKRSKGLIGISLLGIPANAVVTSATLVLKIGNGVNPTLFSPLLVDLVDFGVDISGTSGDYDAPVLGGYTNFAQIYHKANSTTNIPCKDEVQFCLTNAKSWTKYGSDKWFQISLYSTNAVNINSTVEVMWIGSAHNATLNNHPRLKIEYIIPSAVPPISPSNLSVQTIVDDYSGFDITWSDLTNETSYTLFRNITNDTNSANSIVGLPADITNYPDSGLNTNSTYYYWIKAYNFVGQSGYSLVASNTTASVTSVPAQPNIASSLSGAFIDVVWENVANETSYTLYRSTNNFVTIETQFGFNKNITNLLDTTVISGNVYYYYVKAFNVNGESSASTTVSNDLTSPKVFNRTQLSSYYTIGDALSSANDGDLIEVIPGVYKESIDIKKSGIILRATAWTQSSDNTSTIIDATGFTNALIFDNNRSNNMIVGFAIKNSLDTGVLFLNEKDSIISNCIIVSNAVNGIEFNNASTIKCFAINNTISHNGDIGISFTKGISNVAIGNHISQNGKGLYLVKGRDIQIIGNVVNSNTSYGIETRNIFTNAIIFSNSVKFNDIGIELKPFTIGFVGLEINNNEIAKNTTYGIFLQDAYGIIITNNRIHNNVKDGIRGNSYTSDINIVHNSIFSNTILAINIRLTSNTNWNIYENSITGNGKGIRMCGNNTIISNNRFELNNGAGISIATYAVSGRVVENFLTNNAGGISCSKSYTSLTGMNILNNLIVGNSTGRGVFLDDDDIVFGPQNVVRGFDVGLVVTNNPSVLKNNIYNNTMNLLSKSLSAISITNQWWGSGDYTQIIAKVAYSNIAPNVVPYRLFGVYSTVKNDDITSLPIISFVTASVSGTTVNLKWTKAQGGDFARYFIFKSSSSEQTNLTSANIIGQTNNINATNYFIDTISAGQTMYYYVTALDSAPYTNESWYSASAKAVGPTGTFFPPTGLTASVLANTNVVLNWTDGFGETGYVISTNTNSASITTLVSNMTVWTDKTTQDGQTITYYLQATNSTTNSAWISTTVIMDFTPPTTPILISPTNVVVNSINQILNWHSSSDANGVTYTVSVVTNGGTFVTNIATTNFPVVLSEGTNSWSVFAVDNAGNMSGTNVAVVIVDTIAPTTPILISPTNIIVNNVNQILNWHPSTDANGVTYTVGVVTNGVTFVTNIVTTNLSVVLSESTNSWSVFAVDNAGNISGTNVADIIVDTIVPNVVSLNSPASNSTLSTNTATFIWNATTDNSGIGGYILEYGTNSSFVDATTKTTNGTNYIVSGLMNSTYYWRVKAYDMLGNTNMWSSKWIVNIDTNLIIPILHSPTNGTVSSDTTPIFVWSFETGTSSNQIVVDTTTNTFNSTTTNYTNGALSEGSHSWKVRVKTATGWQSFTGIYTYTVDTSVNPATGLNVDVNGSTVDFIWIASGDSDVAGYYIVIDNVTNANLITGTSFSTNLADGTHTWGIVTVDNAGNKTITSGTSVEVSTIVVNDVPVNEFRLSPNPLLQSKVVSGSLMEIKYNSAVGSKVKFEIYTMVGNLVKTITTTDNQGTVEWDGTNDGNNEVASGIYLMIMRVDGKMVYKPIKVGYIRR